MLEALLGLLVGLLILFLFYWVITYALGAFGAPPTVIKLIQIIFVVIAVIMIIGALATLFGVSVPIFSGLG